MKTHQAEAYPRLRTAVVLDSAAGNSTRWIARGAWAAMTAIALCSCHGPAQQAMGPCGPGVPGYAGLPADAYWPAADGCPQPMPSCVCGMEEGAPLPYCPTSPWAPPGIARPWPMEEYVCDGGDGSLPADVTRTGDVRGLEMEDTVAQFDTLDGRTLVQPTNRVCLYAPRFAAVRQVVSLVENDQSRGAVGVFSPERLGAHDYARGAELSTQRLQPTPQIGSKSLTVFHMGQRDGAMSTAIKAKALQDAFKPYENLSVIRTGQMIEAEGALLAKASQAAIAWSHNQAVQVILDRQAAVAETATQNLHAVYTVKHESHPRLRVCKVASTPFAQPGDTISFTIRFDNVGNEAIGNVTIVDNLSPRLEYVPDSGQCSVDAQFFTQPNEGGSLVVRCEIAKPLEVGRGGVLRFECRVR